MEGHVERHDAFVVEKANEITERGRRGGRVRTAGIPDDVLVNTDKLLKHVLDPSTQVVRHGGRRSTNVVTVDQFLDSQPFERGVEVRLRTPEVHPVYIQYVAAASVTCRRQYGEFVGVFRRFCDAVCLLSTVWV